VPFEEETAVGFLVDRPVKHVSGAARTPSSLNPDVTPGSRVWWAVGDEKDPARRPPNAMTRYRRAPGGERETGRWTRKESRKRARQPPQARSRRRAENGKGQKGIAKRSRKTEPRRRGKRGGDPDRATPTLARARRPPRSAHRGRRSRGDGAVKPKHGRCRNVVGQDVENASKRPTPHKQAFSSR